MKKITLILIAAICCIVSSIFTGQALAQTGATCNDAIPETASNSCTFTNYTTTGPEMWLEFTATSTDVQIRVISEAFGTNTPHVHNISLFEGTCGSPNLIAEDELPFIAIANDLAIDASGLILGNTYHIRANVLATATACTRAACPGPAIVSFVLCIQDINVFDPLDFNLTSFGVQEVPSASYTYFTNKGQIVDTDGNPRRDIKLYTIGSSPSVYITDSVLSYVFSSLEEVPPDTSDTMPTAILTGHRVDMQLVGANFNPRVFKTEEVQGHLNYFLGHIPNGITKMKGYSKAVWNGVYPNIDMQFYSNAEGMKIYFIVYPGGDPKDIEMQYTGATNVSVNGLEHLIVTTTKGNMDMEFGHTYSLDSLGNITPLFWDAQYKLMGSDRVRFKVKTYPTNLPLIIQIDRGHQLGAAANPAEWLSHLGGDKEDKVLAVTTEERPFFNPGSVYYTGSTQSSDFPVNTGAFQDTIANPNFSDAFVAGFDFEYRVKFITYLGGAMPDWGSAVSWSPTNGKLYIAGETRGGPNDLGLNFPTRDLGGNSYFDSLYSSGTFETGYIGRMDTATGIPDWLSYFGGKRTFITGMTHDQTGNVYIVGFRQDTLPGDNTVCNNPPNGGFPLCNFGGSAYYQDFHADKNEPAIITDGFFSKFNASGELQHSSFWGGTNPGDGGFDFIYDIAVDNTSSAIYMVGSTNTQRFSAPTCGVPTDGSFPLCSPGGGYVAEDLNLGVAGSQHDGFVAKLDLTTLQLLRSTYFGSSLDDIITGIDVDFSGNKYFVGITKSQLTGSPKCQKPTNNGFPSCSPPAAYNRNFGGLSTLYKKFISKLDINDSLVWSTAIRELGMGDDNTVFGQASIISPRIDVNNSADIFVIGTSWDQSYTNFQSSQYYHQDEHGDFGTPDLVSDAVVTGFDRFDNNLLFSTYLGGAGFESNSITPKIGDAGVAIAALNDRVYVGGYTYSKSGTKFPTNVPLTPSASPYYQPNCVSCDIICTTIPVPKYCSDGFVGQLTIGPFTGIEESPFESNTNDGFPIVAYPNPANDHISLRFDLGEKTELTFGIYNIIGEVIYSERQMYQAGTFEKQLDLSRYAEGMYLIQVKSEKTTRSIKVLKE